jgi:anthranilate/para-aminobenzoate synthase component I
MSTNAKRTKRFKGESRSQLIERLKNKKKNNLILKKAKEEIQNKTGKEYFFKYNSIKNKEFLKKEKDAREDLEKKRIFVDKEICRVEKKLQKYPCIKTKRKVFDEEGNVKEEEKIGEDNGGEREEYEKYLKELIETNKKIENELET